MDIDINPSSVAMRAPVHRNFTLSFDVHLDLAASWGAVVMHGVGMPQVWLNPVDRRGRLWVCTVFRESQCGFTQGLARQTCVYSRGFPPVGDAVAVIHRQVRISLSPSGSFELFEDGTLSSVAVVPHAASSGGDLVPLSTGSQFGYNGASGRLTGLRLTPYVPPSGPPPSPPPVPAEQTLIGDEWRDLAAAGQGKVPFGNVTVGTDWCLSFELWPRRPVSRRALVLGVGRDGAFWLPQLYLRAGSLGISACVNSVGVIDPLSDDDLSSW